MDTGNLEHLVKLVFGQEPRPPHSIQLEIDDANNPHDIFRTLGQLLTHGILFLYGEEESTASVVDIEQIQRYLASIGWKAIINPSSPENHPRVLPYVLAIPIHQTCIRVAFEPLSL